MCRAGGDPAADIRAMPRALHDLPEIPIWDWSGSILGGFKPIPPTSHMSVTVAPGRPTRSPLSAGAGRYFSPRSAPPRGRLVASDFAFARVATAGSGLSGNARPVGEGGGGMPNRSPAIAGAPPSRRARQSSSRQRRKFPSRGGTERPGGAAVRITTAGLPLGGPVRQAFRATGSGRAGTETRANGAHGAGNAGGERADCAGAGCARAGEQPPARSRAIALRSRLDMRSIRPPDASLMAAKQS